MKNEIDVLDPKYYTNRELSWLDFNFRILEEARDHSNLLFERMKFLSITSSNLDEFFMIRVASLKDMVHAKYLKTDIAGMTAAQQLMHISVKTHEMVKKQYSTFNRSLLPALKKAGMNLITKHEQLSESQAKIVDRYFDDMVYPVLTPFGVDSSRPFPLILNESLNIAALIQKQGKKKNGKPYKTQFATIQVPSILPRYFEIDAKKHVGILLEEVIARNLNKLFTNYDILCASPYRIMRNADLDINEEEAADLLKEIQKQLKKRKWGEVIRLEIEEGAHQGLLKRLIKAFHIQKEDVYEIHGPIDLTFLMKLYGLEGFDQYRLQKFIPSQKNNFSLGKDIFEEIKKRDRVLFHPYDTFDPVVEFVEKAAMDPDVLAIKQTLYRVSGHSPIVAALAKAAEQGKQVTVLVELKARFDEENNINWAMMLEKAGCHVLYGYPELKVHSKITLVVRKEEGKIVRYCHLGTGNYNDSTAKLYSDIGLFTCREDYGEDATAFFNMLSGYFKPESFRKLLVAPNWMENVFLDKLEYEIKQAKKGKKARVIVKVNSLCDKNMIAALYKASMVGVKISLIVRGICCLKAGLPDVSENIEVRSIVGEFLEHARIFYFYHGGEEEMYMGSADWMPRNLEKRIEIIFPVEDEAVKEEVKEILRIQLEDTLKARVMQKNGSYKHVDLRGKKKLSSQEYFKESRK